MEAATENWTFSALKCPGREADLYHVEESVVLQLHTTVWLQAVVINNVQKI